MATEVEHDPVTGRPTTGHEWDDIKELNTPLPKWWLYILYATIIWSVVWWVLYPSWPGIHGYFGGILGYNQRAALEQRMAEAAAARAVYLERLEGASLEEIANDPELLSVAFAGGGAVFADNCAPCHGLGGAGQGFYPTLADDSWLWGGSLDEIERTILYGVRSDHPDTRLNEMPAFGALEILGRSEVADAADYVFQMSGQEHDAAAAERGAVIFAEQCASCHGEDGKGIAELGAPDLTDQLWLYGGTRREIVQQVYAPRHGVMPAWAGRLSPEAIKSLTIYVHGLGGGQ
jgi:cytochrome c oxidase cbb3-type subunit III